MSVSGFPSADELRQLLERALQEGAKRSAIERIEWLLFYRASGESVAATCRAFGIARGTFYRVAQVLDIANWRTLELQSRRPNTVSKTHLSDAIVALVRLYRQKFPAEGKEAIRIRLLREHNLFVSASAIGRLIAREKLFFADSLLHERKRGDFSNAVLDSVQSEDIVSVTTTAPVRLWKKTVAGLVFSVVILLAAFAFGMRQGLKHQWSEQLALHAAATDSDAAVNTYCSIEDFSFARQ